MKNKQVSVLIPNSCNDPLAYYGIRCLKEASSEFNINIIVSSDKVTIDNSWLVFYKHSAYIDNLWFSENIMDSAEYLEVIQIIENRKIDIVFPASEVSFKVVSKYREKLLKSCKLVALPSEDTLHTAFDKWKLHLFLKKYSISTPETVVPREVEDISKSDYPVILKPIDGSGGKNIQKIDTLGKESLQLILNHGSDGYIVQEYVDGYDMGCSVLCREGQILAYTIQQQLGLVRGFTPKIDKLKFVHDSAVIDIVTRTVNALKWSGIANLDLRYNSQTGQIYLIEINPRFWQSLMGSLSIGVNLPYLLYLISSDISFGPVSYLEKYYAKFQRFTIDTLNGSLEYNLSDTNLKYFLSDPNSLLQLLFHKGLEKILPQQVKNV